MQIVIFHYLTRIFLFDHFGGCYIYDIQYTNSTGYKFFTLMFADNIYLCSHQNYEFELEFMHIGPSSHQKLYCC